MSPSPKKNESGTGSGLGRKIADSISLGAGIGGFYGVAILYVDVVIDRVIPPFVEALNQLFPHAHESPIWSSAVVSLVLCAMWVGITEILGSPPLNRLRPNPGDPNAAPSLGILPKATFHLMAVVVVSVYMLLITWIDVNKWWAILGPVLPLPIVFAVHFVLRPRVYTQPLLQWARENYFLEGEEDEAGPNRVDPSNGTGNHFDPRAAQQHRFWGWSIYTSSTAIYGALMAIASTQEGARPAWLWPLAALGVVLFSAGFFVFRTQALDPVRNRTLDLSSAKDTDKVLFVLVFAWAMATGMALCGLWLVYSQENPARYGWPFLAGAALLLFITRPWALTPHPK